MPEERSAERGSRTPSDRPRGERGDHGNLERPGARPHPHGPRPAAQPAWAGPRPWPHG